MFAMAPLKNSVLTFILFFFFLPALRNFESNHVFREPKETLPLVGPNQLFSGLILPC